MKQLSKITLGADPEVFLRDKISKEIVSAEGLIGGTKDEPKAISAVGHSVQEDNVMAEFNIPAAIDAASFSRDIQFVLDYLNDNTPDNLETHVLPSAILDKKYLETDQALMFGCEPDFCVWKAAENEPPNAESDLRTCGGHIHVGFEDPEFEQCEAVIQAMDLFLGVPSILMDTDTRRREMYGKAGAFRTKDYGVEYRTLSNFWIATDELRQWAFNNTLKAIEFINEGNTISPELEAKIVECIDTQNSDLAEELVKEFNITIIEPVTEVVAELQK